MRGTRLASGARLEQFARLDSTSLEARRRVAAGTPSPAFLVAVEQTAAYGRRGTAWIQEPGDFAGTLLFEENAPPDRLGQLSFVAALAVLDALSAAAPGAPFALKWPNDVLLADAKLAGILLELLERRGDRAWMALGVGVNVVSKPDGLGSPTSRLIDYCRPSTPSAADLAATIDAAFDRWRGVWRRQGFSPIRAAWLSACAHRTGQVRVRTAEGDVVGAFVDLDEDGGLRLNCAGAARVFAAGTVLPPEGGAFHAARD